jgi:hypothetical protein
MNISSFSVSAKRNPITAAIFLAGLLGIFAINGQSFWLDEFGTWLGTRPVNFMSWLDHFIHWNSSDAQIPLYHLYMWLWSHMSPQSEISWRWSNFPWLILAFYPLLRAPVAAHAIRLTHAMLLILMLHPITWYYTNELRPYIALMSGTLLTGVGLIGQYFPSEQRREWDVSRNFMICGISLMMATSALGVIWALPFAFLSIWIMYRSNGATLGLSRQNVFILLICCLILIPIAYQYVSTFLNGISASPQGHKIVNFLFGFYEISGASGLGPGRDDLRLTAASALTPYAAPLLLYVALTGTCAAYGAVKLFQRSRSFFLPLVALTLLPLTILLTLGEVRHWRVVGRHMIPLLFFFILITAQGIISLWDDEKNILRSGVRKSFSILTLSVLLASAVSITFSERHEREMYGNAAALAQQTMAHDGIVWWFADGTATDYYRLNSRLVISCMDAKPGSLVLIKSVEQLDHCQTPQAALMTRPNTYDSQGVGRRALEALGLKKQKNFQGFEYWKEKNSAVQHE